MRNFFVSAIFAIAILSTISVWSEEPSKSVVEDPEKLFIEEQARWEKMHERFKKNTAAFKIIKDDPNLPRVLLIGDSISIGYTPTVREKLAGKANVHRALSNCGHTKTGLAWIKSWLGPGKWDVIHFNWGLHDVSWNLHDAPPEKRYGTPLKEYKANLEKLVKILKGTGAKLIWASTTPVPEGAKGRRPSDGVAYNAAALEIMKKNGIEVNDLYAYVAPELPKYQLPKNVHFKREGSAFLGEEVARKISKKLKK